MLYIQDKQGKYLPAPQDVIFQAGRRLSSSQLRRSASIESSINARAAIQDKLHRHQCETFACLFLDSRHRIIAFREMFRGTINKTTIHPREVVKEALACNASAVIIAHNHPSGETTPSKSDIELTEKLAAILSIVDIQLLDHLIVGDEVVALTDLGLMPQM